MERKQAWFKSLKYEIKSDDEEDFGWFLNQGKSKIFYTVCKRSSIFYKSGKINCELHN